MLRLRSVSVAVSLLTLVACTLPPADTRRPREQDPAERAIPPEATDDARKAAECIDAFAADLYAQLRTESGNLIVSPYSVGLALAMAGAGAEGTTARELDTVLHLPIPGKTSTGSAFQEMTACVTAAPRGVKRKPELSVANSLWLEQGHPWKPDFLATARDDFRAGLFEANFRGNPEGERGSINRWVEKETHNRIKDLVPPDGITTETRIVLANAISFKAQWAAAFQRDKTNPEEFTRADGQTIRAPLMYQRGDLWLKEADGFQVLKLPYDGNTTSMYVLLPETNDGLPALEQRLGAANLANWTGGQGGTTEVKVWLPRFKFTVPTELAGVLKKMGVKDAFDRNRANFKGMTDHPDGIYITRVIHKAFVELDEVGTEAAAATAIIGLPVAAPGSHPPPREHMFRADHPFLFVIKHEPTGAILFMGRVLDPTK